MRRFLKMAAPAAAFLCLGLFADARASLVTDLFDTGTVTSTTNGSTLATPGSPDANYSLTSLASSTAYVLTGLPSSYVGNTATSQFIGPSADGFAQYPVNTFYTYTTTFTINGGFTSALLTGAVASDDQVAITLNGVNEGLYVGYGAFNPFSISTDFVSGTNTLSFVVENTHPSTPTALQVNALVGTYSVPEPASMALMGIGGIAAFGFSRFRRRRTA